MKKDEEKRKAHEELVGTTVGGLSILELYYSDNLPQYTYKCNLCDYNGKTTWYLIKKKKSTGCRKCANRRNGQKKWTGFGEMSGEYFYSLNRRNRDFTISKEYSWELFLSQNRKCALSNIPLSFSTGSNIRDGNASIDRIDNSIGYIEGNIRWVDKNINMMRRKLLDDHFIWFCRQVTSANENREVVTPDTSIFIV